MQLKIEAHAVLAQYARFKKCLTRSSEEYPPERISQISTEFPSKKGAYPESTTVNKKTTKKEYGIKF